MMMILFLEFMNHLRDDYVVAEKLNVEEWRKERVMHGLFDVSFLQKWKEKERKTQFKVTFVWYIRVHSWSSVLIFVLFRRWYLPKIYCYFYLFFNFLFFMFSWNQYPWLYFVSNLEKVCEIKGKAKMYRIIIDLWTTRKLSIIL